MKILLITGSENYSGKRILRHKEPVIIIPYYKHTREEELVEKMLENYNSELITTVNNIEDIII